MMRKALRLAVVFTIGVIVLGRAPGAWACSCVEQTTAEHFRDADAVFAGRATAREDPNASAPAQSSGDPIRWTFGVESVQKGEVSDPATVTSARDGATCGFQFEIGGRYQVFASEQDGRLETGICSGTTVVAAGEAPYSGRLPRTGVIAGAAGALALAGAAALGAFLRRGPRRPA